VPTSKELALQSLNIFLMKEGVQHFADALQKGRFERLDLTAAVGVPALLFIKRTRSHLPDWHRFFVGAVDPAAFGRVSSASALLLARLDDRLFGLPFGQGRYLLNLDKVEERFGLKVCLNSIDSTAIRSIDKRSFDALLTQSRVQTSKAAPISDFGLDVEQDLLRAVTGTPIDNSLGERMAGLDSLGVSARVGLPDLKALLPKYLRAYQSTKYRTKYPWVDQIAEIRTDAEVVRLNAKLVAAFEDPGKHRLWMALPDVVDWTRVHGFRHSHRREAPLHYDAHLEEWIADAAIGIDISLELLMRKRVFASDSSGQDFADWSVYKCLYCEIEEGNTTYLLSAGKWYRVKKDLVEQVNASFASVVRRAVPLPTYAHDSEGAYNIDVARRFPQEFSCHDGKLITVPGSGSPIEVCDLYSRQQEFIHVKRYGASSLLSHHFAQAVISAEALSLDRSARDTFAKQVKAPLQFDPRSFQPAAHTIVLAVISDQDGELTLPFFSRLNLRHAERRLRSMGFPVNLSKVEVEPQTKKLKKYVTRPE
jgi:uncharacterized protein (TIGR04141 family)